MNKEETKQYRREQMIQKTIPSLILFIVGFVVVFIFFTKGYSLSDRIWRSFFIGWYLGGLIWGWSLTKKLFPNFRWTDPHSGRQDDVGRFASVMHIFGIACRIAIALAVGIVALPIGIIITIVTTIKVGKDAYDKAYKEAVEAEAAKNSQENTNTPDTQ